MSLSEKFDWVLNYFKVSPFRPYLMRRTALAFDQSNRVCACARFFVLAYTFLTLSLSLSLCVSTLVFCCSLYCTLTSTKDEKPRKRKDDATHREVLWLLIGGRTGKGWGVGLVNVEDATSKKRTNKENQTKTNPIRLSNPRRENQCGCLFYVTVLGKPHNPLINAGALVTTSLLLSLVRPESTIADKFEYIKDSYKVKTTPPRRPLHTTATDRQHHRSKLIGSEGNSRFPCATVRYFFSTSLIGCC